MFVAYDKNACWTNPQNGKTSGATDAAIVATYMMLEAASLDIGSVWISYFDEEKQENCFACLKAGSRYVCFISAILQRTLCQTQS
ncbi:MAG TPA: nitroreductase family protein [Candidatus Coprocola pullicola]|nr:nitroreductase family protein [Candidatus Coprocola pullicola]